MLKQLHDKHTLYIEDDEALLHSTMEVLKYFVKTIHWCKEISEARTIMNNHQIDFIISDIMLEEGSSLTFIEEMRKQNNFIPIIIISGYKDEEMLLRAIPLKLTAYMLKPIQYDVLMHSLTLCATELNALPQSHTVLNDGWHYINEKKVLKKQGVIYSLTQKESLFIELLVQNKNVLITKEMIKDYVWREDHANDQTIANLLTRIRKRFGKSFIYTIRDLGYRLHR